AVRRMGHEIGDEHFDGEQKSYRSREETKHQKQPPEEFQNTGDEHLVRELRRSTFAPHASEHSEKFLRSVRHEQKPNDDAKESVKGSGESRKKCHSNTLRFRN